MLTGARTRRAAGRTQSADADGKQNPRRRPFLNGSYPPAGAVSPRHGDAARPPAALQPPLTAVRKPAAVLPAIPLPATDGNYDARVVCPPAGGVLGARCRRSSFHGTRQDQGRSIINAARVLSTTRTDTTRDGRVLAVATPGAGT